MSIGGGQGELRVILVGRTGLDAALRQDPDLELIRAKTPLDAVGELATPIDSDSPSQALVIVGQDIQSSLAPTPASAQEFELALRLVDPAVQIVGVRGEHHAFEREIDAHLGSDGVRGLAGLAPLPRTNPALQLAGSEDPHAPDRAASGTLHDPAPDPTQDPSGEAIDDRVGDAAIVEVMLRGRDVLAAALAVLRTRVGDTSVEFQTQPGASSVRVESTGAVHGHLLAQGTPPEVLRPHARWLARWLRLRDQQAQLRDAAFTDSLTGAYNRRYFDRYLATAIEGARASQWNVSVLMFDLDNFKSYNDAYGHDAGDELLTETTRLLRSVLRPSDRVCRIGGDEFAVIFHDPHGPRTADSKPPASVFEIATRFQEQIRGHKFPKLAHLAPGTLTVSGGLATFPWDGSTPSELLARADERAMQSKRQGKNAITIGPPTHGA